MIIYIIKINHFRSFHKMLFNGKFVSFWVIIFYRVKNANVFKIFFSCFSVSDKCMIICVIVSFCFLTSDCLFGSWIIYPFLSSLLRLLSIVIKKYISPFTVACEKKTSWKIYPKISSFITVSLIKCHFHSPLKIKMRAGELPPTSRQYATDLRCHYCVRINFPLDNNHRRHRCVTSPAEQFCLLLILFLRHH